MGHALRYRLFKVGRMPPTLRDAASGALFSAEGVSLKIRGRSVKLPALRSGRSVKLSAGSLVLRPDRMLASVGKYVLVDSELVSGEGPYRVGFAADGVTLSVDIAALFPDGAGSAEYHWDVELDPKILAASPSEPTSVHLPEQTAALVRNTLG